MPKENNTRRNFIKSTVGLAGTLSLPWIVPASALGSNGEPSPSSRINLGLIGTGNINTHHREVFLAEKDTRIVGVCDPVTARRDAFRNRINQAYQGDVCKDYRDFRTLLARPDIDAVCIATPDHWHALLAITAMQAGKDVYVEKPLTHTISEGCRVVEATERYGRILQTGLQRRSGDFFRRACELVRNGRIGRLTHVEVGIIGINRGVQVGQNFPTAPVPSGFDYELWLGPAPTASFSPQRVARGNEVCYWYYISDYTVGFISGNGVHFVDIAQWGIGDEVRPVEVHTPWANIPADGLVDDAIAWQSEVSYSNGVRMSYSSEGNPHPDGIRFIGTEGWIHVTGGGTLSADPAPVLTSVIKPGELHLHRSPEHHRNFLDCIKTRQRTAASAQIGHSATTTCNLVEIAARVARKVKWDAQAGRCVDDDAADRLRTRTMRSPWHL